MYYKRSILIRPLTILLDLFLINFILLFDKEYFNLIFLTYINLLWLIIAYQTKFYNVYRYTHITKLITLCISQFFIFGLAYLSYFSVFREGEVVNNQTKIFIVIFSVINLLKFLLFFLLRRYRISGRNYRNIILFGEQKLAKNLESLFDNKNDLGYRFFGFFSNRVYNSKNYLGSIKDAFNFILENKIDEIYCDPVQLAASELNNIRSFTDKHKLEFRLVPENKAIYSKNLTVEYIGTTPILKPKKLPFEKFETHIIKRIFDLTFALFICVFVLIWLLPILWFAIKFTSKGPFFFKQKRDGLNGKEFYCYKLRSMKVNNEADIVSATKNDKRITKVGSFLRRTSLDELPQFYNVIKGEMSVVGPRPHIKVQNEKYTSEIENYLMRNSVKPGITGLAQISGYRGEIIKKSDIKNRVKLDIFYIENWSLFLDLKIIVLTVLNFFKKDEKAY